jgi:hypothetical protein
MNRIKDIFFFLVASTFLGVNWLWNKLDHIIWRLVSFIPITSIQESLVGFMNGLPPYPALLLFILPYIIILPLKFLGFWLIAEGQWLLGISLLLIAKLLGFGLLAFLFDIGREKFLSIPWFKAIYTRIIAFREWCHHQIDPYKKQLHILKAYLSEAVYNSAFWKKISEYIQYWRDRF